MIEAAAGMAKCRPRRGGTAAGRARLLHEESTTSITKLRFRERGVLTPRTRRRGSFHHRRHLGRCRDVIRDVLLNGSDKAIAAPMHRLDEKLLAAAVAQGAPHRPEPLRQGAFTDYLVGPELFQEFVFGDHAVAMLQEVDEHIEALALQGAKGVAAAEFAALRIELVIAKDIDHAIAPSLYVSSLFRRFKHDEVSDTHSACLPGMAAPSSRKCHPVVKTEDYCPPMLLMPRRAVGDAILQCCGITITNKQSELGASRRPHDASTDDSDRSPRAYKGRFFEKTVI